MFDTMVNFECVGCSAARGLRATVGLLNDLTIDELTAVVLLQRPQQHTPCRGLVAALQPSLGVDAV